MTSAAVLPARIVYITILVCTSVTLFLGAIVPHAVPHPGYKPTYIIPVLVRSVHSDAVVVNHGAYGGPQTLAAGQIRRRTTGVRTTRCSSCKHLFDGRMSLEAEQLSSSWTPSRLQVMSIQPLSARSLS